MRCFGSGYLYPCLLYTSFSNVYKNLLADYKVKIDDIKNRIDIDLNRFNEASEADAKESLVITIFIPIKYIGKIELSVNAGTLNITDIENEHIEVNGKISEVTLQGNKSEIEIEMCIRDRHCKSGFYD